MCQRRKRVRNIFLHSDFCYGPDNPMLWSQPYLTQYPHLGAILKWPEDCNHSLSIMWWNPTHDDFQPLENNFTEGLGQLSLLNLWRLEEKLNEIEDKIMEYCKTTSSPNPLLLLLAELMRHGFSCLCSLKSAFGQMRFSVTKFQPYYLEIYALLDYLQIYKPCMDGAQPVATAVANCIGALPMYHM